MHPSRVRDDWRGMLLKGHDWFFDRRIDALLFVPTRKRRGMRARGEDPGPDSRAAACAALGWAIDAIPEDTSRFTFVDYDAGRGRSLLAACQRPFKKAVGIAPHPPARAQCELNIAQFPRSRMKCRDLDCLSIDPADYEPPADQVVAYFFAPEDESRFQAALDRLALSYVDAPRRIYVLFVGFDAGATMTRHDAFQRVKIDARQRVKLALLSPHTISLYRSLA